MVGPNGLAGIGRWIRLNASAVVNENFCILWECVKLGTPTKKWASCWFIFWVPTSIQFPLGFKQPKNDGGSYNRRGLPQGGHHPNWVPRPFF